MQKNRDREIRRLVLDKLRELYGDSISVAYGNLANVCNISTGELERHIKYWEEKKFVETTSRRTPSSFSEVQLTAFGIDFLEGEGSKPSVVQNLHISNSNVGHIQGSGTIVGDVNVNNGLEFLNHLQNLIEKNTEIPETEKPSLVSRLKELTNNATLGGILSNIALKLVGS